MTRSKALLLTGLAVLMLLGLALFRHFPVGEHKSEQFLMDTVVSVKVYGRDQEKLKQGVAEAFAEMRRIAELADGFAQPGTAAYDSSDVCRINEKAGKEPVRVDADTMAMLLLSKKYHGISGGAFDVTVGPLMDLWGFGGKNPRIPGEAAIEAALEQTGSEKLVLDEKERTAFLTMPGMKLDLGGVAKGYATEKAMQLLKSRGIEKALIDAGGNIRTLGRNVQDDPWKIGIRDPRRSEEILAVLPLEDASAVTSGDYHRFFEVAGKRYHHILDPRTGHPARRNMSVTVVTRDAALADLLSTVCFVLPPGEALELAGKQGVELFVVASDGVIRHTPGLRVQIKVTSGDGYRYDEGR